jgi:spore maturation protein CgeB
MPWYAAHRDLPVPSWGNTDLYGSIEDLALRFGPAVSGADLVIVGSYVPEGVQVGEWALGTARGIVAYYDIDTPVTLAKLAAGDEEYLSARLIPGFHLYLSFTGGPSLELLEKRYGARKARPFYCSVDPALHYPEPLAAAWDLGYLGTYSPDRQPALDRLLLAPAAAWPEGRFVVAGPQFPAALSWPANVGRMEHLPPPEHRRFYNAQRFTLNVTREDMVRAGWSPSVRLFEAAACGVPIVSDWWEGLDSLFEPGREILVPGSGAELLDLLKYLGEAERLAIGRRSRARILAEHTAAHRVLQLEDYLAEAVSAPVERLERCPPAAPHSRQVCCSAKTCT